MDDTSETERLEHDPSHCGIITHMHAEEKNISAYQLLSLQWWEERGAGSIAATSDL